MALVLAVVLILSGIRRICTNWPALCFLASILAEGTPVRANDFSQSCDEAPRILPSMNASPGQRVQLETCEHDVHVVSSFRRIARPSLVFAEVRHISTQ